MKQFTLIFWFFMSTLTLWAGVGDDPKKDTLSPHFNWFNQDFTLEQILGLGTDRAYNEMLKDKSSKTVIVAVIDSGVDIDHEDLQGKIWVNEDEIPGNGIDDDSNGYVDDIHGWNFLGGPEGNVVNETLELTRLYRELSDRFEGKQSSNIAAADRADYNLYLRVKQDYEKELADAQQLAEQWVMFELSYNFSDAVMKYYLNKEEYNIDDVREIEEQNDSIAMAKGFLLQIHEAGFETSQVDAMRHQIESTTKYHLNLGYDPRELVGDDPNNLEERFYGNNDVEGEFPEHGTHVAGIIAANRKNDIGIKGIVDNVQIMAIRAVPNGDERDKDIANAIRYAVENGAQIINMSFGKPFSPGKKVVDDAFKFAEERGVLIVHGSGNEGKNIDETQVFPTPNFSNGESAGNWITVGASDKRDDLNMPASFSNYGKENVDLFAPGVNVYSLKPNNQYVAQDGTSMACPMASGVAALLLSYFPDLSINQVKAIMLKTVNKQKKTEVIRPQEQSLESEMEPQEVKFGELSNTGGVLNAYDAVKLAVKKSKAF